ncbi:MAG: hypothetical protein BWY75_00040 [bacterium ADurb.Bin425]|nr:MAG: hypothetical protein BWY75_00040 [bacterium ADurb.Bin425]
MQDDFESDICNGKHYGPILGTEDGVPVMRCSFCERIFRDTAISVRREEPKKRSSKTCISACDWVINGNTVRCNACSYSGPVPNLGTVEQR